MDGKKRISCRRCQLRKLKCTRVNPCDNCVNSGYDCSFREDDVRRRPVNRAYVTALEERIASYEATIRSFQQQHLPNALPHRPLEALAHTKGADQRAGNNDSDLIFDYDGSSRVSTLVLQPSPQGHRSFYGPTSIYQKGCVSNDTGNASRVEQPQTLLTTSQDIHMLGIFRVEDVILDESLPMFFRHLSAECPFIDEMILMQDFTHNKHMGRFWSHPLLSAICCLGARISRHKQVAGKVDGLVQYAHKLLSLKRLGSPRVTTVQAYLCLSMYEFGAGNNIKGWMLSGMAFRMVQDMGLHQDPKFLIEDDLAISSPQDSRMRRRVYWGCYIVDKVISLYFGRPVNLREDDASVDPLGLQDDQFGIPEPDPSNGFLPASIPSSLILVHLTRLSKIIESMMTEVFSTKLIKLPRKNLVSHRVAQLEELNVQFFQWHANLPNDLAWNQWTPSTQNLPPELAILHALYHSCIISLHRHFVRPTPGFARKDQSRELCMSSADSIMALTRQYRAQHSLSTAPLVLIYSLAMAATAVTMALGSTVEHHDQSSGTAQHMNFILKTLNECSTVYDVASHIGEKLEENTISKRHPQQKKTQVSQEDHSYIPSGLALENLQIEMETSACNWRDSDVLNLSPQDDTDDQWLFPQEWERDMIAQFDWSNMMI